MNAPITTTAAAWLLLRVRLRRSARAFTNVWRKKKKDVGARTATAPKPTAGGFYTALFAVGMFSYGLKYANDLHRNIERTLIDGTWNSVAATTQPAVMAVSAMLMALFAASLLFALNNKELANPEWDLEWLGTLPLPTGALLTLRLLERAVGNTAAFFMFTPFFIWLAWELGTGLLAVPLAVALLLPLVALLGALEVVLEITLRRTLRPSSTRNVQAICSVLAPLALMPALFLTTGMHNDLLLAVAKATPRWLAWTPPGLAAEVVVGGRNRGPAAILLVVQAVVVVMLARLWLGRILRGGLVLGGSRESHRRPLQSRPQLHVSSRPAPLARWLSPLQRRELRLLLRDRSFMVRAIVTPAMVTGIQLAFSARGAGLMDGPKAAAATAFGAGAYSLMFSAYQSLASEGRALWLLYTVPRSIERIVIDKALFWAGVATGFPAIILVVAGVRSAFELQPASVLRFVFAFLGLPLFAIVATALGVTSANPLEEEPAKRLKLSHLYLFMLLSGAYIYAVTASSPWTAIVVIVLLCALVFALWQNARDHLPYLLDPTSAPAARVSLSDGLVGALVFLFAQIFTSFLLLDEGHTATSSDVFIAFGVAGLVTFTSMRVAFALQKVRGLPRYFGARWRRALALGAVAGAAAGAVGASYQFVLRHLAVPLPANVQVEGSPLWLVAAAVLLAPIFEEWLFRGLVFRGLLRSWPKVWAAAASSLVFAIIHPPLAAPAVFVLALLACWVYERTDMLLAPVVAHAVYNAMVVAAATV